MQFNGVQVLSRDSDVSSTHCTFLLPFCVFSTGESIKVFFINTV